MTDIRAAPTAATPAPGSAWPTVVAIVVVLALGCLTALLAIRRKRTG